MEPGFAGLTKAEREAALDLLQVLFPRLKGVFGNHHFGDDWDQRWQREQRICADAYFARYFHYGIPPRDISDQTITGIIEAAGNSAEAAAARIAEIGRAGGANVLVQKLRSRRKHILPENAKRLALAVARSGAVFPRERSMYGDIVSTFGQAGILVRNLADQLTTGEERERLAEEVITSAEPIPFAIQCFRWLRGDRKEPDAILSLECEGRLGKLIANRIQAAAARDSPHELWPEDASAVYWFWMEYGPTGIVAKYLEERFSSHPAEVVDFLLSFTPTGWGLESGLSHRGDFRQDCYKAVADLISPDLIMAICAASLALRLTLPSFTSLMNCRLEHG